MRETYANTQLDWRRCSCRPAPACTCSGCLSATRCDPLAAQTPVIWPPKVIAAGYKSAKLAAAAEEQYAGWSGGTVWRATMGVGDPHGWSSGIGPSLTGTFPRGYVALGIASCREAAGRLS